MDIHHGTADIFQFRLADHILIHNGSGIGVDIVDAEYRQKIGQQCYQAQQDDRQDQTLL